MDQVLVPLRYLHIIFGMGGLIAFWIPIFARKGGRVHLVFGRLFVWSVYGVCASAVVSVSLRLISLLRRGIGTDEAGVQYALLVLLGYLALTTFASARFAVDVARTKTRPEPMRTFFYRFLIGACCLSGISVFGFALLVPTPFSLVLMSLSFVGPVNARAFFVHIFKPTAKRDWLYAHMGAIFGAGIAFNTAFAVFGFSRLTGLQAEGFLAILPWILPAIIGVPGSIIWQRVYRKKFADLPTRKPILHRFRKSKDILV